MASSRDIHRVIFEQTAGRITAVCSRYVSDREDLKDVVQETYIKAFASYDRFRDRGKGSLEAWLSRIAVNVAIDYLRRRGRLGFVESVPDLPDLPDDPPDVDSLSQEDIMEAIQALPDGYRTVFSLVVFEKKSHREIATMLGISEGTSASQFHRAKAILAQALRQKQKENERRMDR